MSSRESPTRKNLPPVSAAICCSVASPWVERSPPTPTVSTVTRSSLREGSAASGVVPVLWSPSLSRTTISLQERAVWRVISPSALSKPPPMLVAPEATNRSMVAPCAVRAAASSVTGAKSTLGRSANDATPAVSPSSIWSRNTFALLCANSSRPSTAMLPERSTSSMTCRSSAPSSKATVCGGGGASTGSPSGAVAARVSWLAMVSQADRPLTVSWNVSPSGSWFDGTQNSFKVYGPAAARPPRVR